MTFELYDALTAGQQVGVTLNQNNVAVTAGVFDVLLDFGDAPFNNAPRWLEIEVREAGVGNYTTLSPRQRVGAAPFAIETLFVAPGSVDTAALQDNSVTTTKIANGNVFTDDLANFAVATNKLSNQAVTRLKIADDAIGTSQIENGSVASTDIRDGTITAIDINGGVLMTDKEDLYEVRSATSTVASLKRTRTVACKDENDLAVWAGCDAQISGTGLVFNKMFEFWNSNTAAASLTCTGMNNEPAIQADFEAVIWCIAKP
jgi:hypothetical protein